MKWGNLLPWILPIKIHTLPFCRERPPEFSVQSENNLRQFNAICLSSLYIFNYPAFQTLQFLSNYVFLFFFFFSSQTFVICQFWLSIFRTKSSLHLISVHRRHFHCLHFIYSLSFVLILTNREALKTCWCGTLHVNTAQLLRYMSPINLRTLNAGKQGEKKAPILQK